MTKTKTIISLHENTIRYITLAKNDYGFYIEKYDFAELDEGIIKNGEILKAEFLTKILTKIQKKVDTKSIHLLLPHSSFLFDLHSIETKGKKKYTKIIEKYLLENITNISWATSHSYEYDVFHQKNNLQVLFRALPQDLVRSYHYVFKKAGFSIASIHSELLAYQPLFEKREDILQIFVDDDHTYLLNYRRGIFHSDKKFNFSYKQLKESIKKNVSISPERIDDILEKYGVLKTHDERVLKQIERKLSPLFDFLRKKKMKKDTLIYVHFRHTPLKGFSDRLRKLFAFDVRDLCVLCSSSYTFQDVLSIHKKESYDYEPLIARALTLFEKK